MSTRRGFSLIEVLAALSLLGLVLVLGLALVETMRSASSRTDRAADDLLLRGTGERLLADLLSRAREAPGEGVALTGTELTMTFHSECESAMGWLQPCNVLLRVAGDAPPIVELAASSGAEWMRFGLPLQASTIRYLPDASAGARWRDGWSAGRVPPYAVALVSGADSVVFKVGAY